MKKSHNTNRELPATLRKRTPEQWVELLEQIKDKTLKNKVGCLVWWDYFAQRTTKNAVPHFDVYRNGYEAGVNNQPDDDDLIKALDVIGYKNAKKRVIKNQDKPSLTSQRR